MESSSRSPLEASSKGLASPPEEDLTGQTLADYHVLRRLGQGGMGHVYLAEQLSLKRKIALKILKSELSANPISLKRFKAEGEAVARVAHANIVQVYAVGEANGLHFIALEYVDGFTLRDYLAKKGPPALPLALGIMRQTAAALQRAGEMGIIHRDIKPENILLSRKGEVKVADFGLSRCLAPDQQPLALTQSGITMGTPLYMSPEQVAGKALDPRTDIYSLGVTWYHMLSGNPPFRGETAFEVALQHVQAQPKPLTDIRPDLPGELCAVVGKMMAKRPEERYQSAGELLKEINRVRNDLTATQKNLVVSSGTLDQALSQPTPVLGTQVLRSAKAARKKKSAPRSRLKPWFWVAGIGSILLALGVGAVLGRQKNPSSPPPALPAPARAPENEAEAALRKHEEFLKIAIQEYANPRDANQRKLAMGHCLELGLFYLDHWRLADADQFFNGLTSKPNFGKAFHLVGKLGHGIVLAFQDHPLASDQQFLDVIQDKDATKSLRPLLNGNPRFLQVLVKALDFNAANCRAAGKPFPPVLEGWRKAQPLPTPPGANGRANGLGKPGDNLTRQGNN